MKELFFKKTHTFCNSESFILEKMIKIVLPFLEPHDNLKKRRIWKVINVHIGISLTQAGELDTFLWLFCTKLIL